MRFEGMVADTLAYLDSQGVGRTHVVGFSDDAITGLLLAMDHPERVRSLVAMSANLDPGAFVDDDADDTDDDMLGVREAYERLSPDGPAHADVLLTKLMQLWTSEPQIAASALARIVAPTLVLAGDGDSITTDHTALIARSIPGAQLCIVPGAGHMVAQDRPDLVNLVLREFLAAQSTRTADLRG